MSGALNPALAVLLSDPRLALRRPPPGVNLDQYRAAANGFMARAPLPQVHSSVDHLIDTKGGVLRLRLIRPTGAPDLPAILFVHGGGFILGSLETHEAMARALALSANAVVAAVDYRLAPEHPYPAALEDAASALNWLTASGRALRLDPSHIAIAGDSAGAQIAAALVSDGDNRSAVRHLALLYPLLDPTRSSVSSQLLSEGYMLTGEFIDWAWQSYTDDASNPQVNLLRASLEAFPPTTIVTAEFDPLRDEGEAFADRLRSAGALVESRCMMGMIHGFAGLPHIIPAAATEALDWVGQRIGAALAA